MNRSNLSKISSPAGHAAAAPKPTADKFEQTMYQRGLFLNMALNMSWQLAVIVIVPIVGGYELDQHLKIAPWLTIVGFLLAAGGFVAVLFRVVAVANRRAISAGKPGVKK